jgi:hypothetical protein
VNVGFDLRRLRLPSTDADYRILNVSAERWLTREIGKRIWLTGTRRKHALIVTKLWRRIYLTGMNDQLTLRNDSFVRNDSRRPNSWNI